MLSSAAIEEEQSLEVAIMSNFNDKEKNQIKRKSIPRRHSTAKMFLEQIGGLLPNPTLHSIITTDNDFPLPQERDLKEEEFGLIIDSRERAILGAIYGIVNVAGLDLWFKTEHGMG